MSSNEPKVSCLCLSYRRPHALKNAIACFNSQSYPNKELVVVHRSTDSETRALLNSVKQENIKVVEVQYEENTTLGDVRNISLSEASGDYICVWDDDDWYHQRRIEIQLNSILESGKKASLLFYILMYDKKNERSFMSPRHSWEQSVMCHRQTLVDHDIKYPSLDRGEDKEFVRRLIQLNAIVPVVNPLLYIYCYNGSNTCDEGHFEMLFGYAQKLTQDHTGLIKKVFEMEYSVEEGSDALSQNWFIGDLKYIWDVTPGKH